MKNKSLRKDPSNLVNTVVGFTLGAISILPLSGCYEGIGYNSGQSYGRLNTVYIAPRHYSSPNPVYIVPRVNPPIMHPPQPQYNPNFRHDSGNYNNREMNRRPPQEPFKGSSPNKNYIPRQTPRSSQGYNLPNRGHR
jgi:hypothetical protein